MAKMCGSCIFNDGDDVEAFCIALERPTADVVDEDCDCFEPIMDGGDEE